MTGSFADSERAFEDHFADTATRPKDIAGGYLLLLSALALVWFACTLRQLGTEGRVMDAAFFAMAAMSAAGPRWLRVKSWPVAAALLLAPLYMPALLLPAWVATVGGSTRWTRQPSS